MYKHILYRYIYIYIIQARERYQNLSKEEKKATMWSSTLQKSLRR